MKELEELYRQHAPAVFRFACGLCGDRNAAEDIVSETFVRIATGTSRIRSRTALAYLLTVARNVHLSTLARQRPQVPLSEEMPTRHHDIHGKLDEQKRLASVLRALADLPEGERAALLLRVEHEMPYDEIAVALGTTVGAAKVRVHRARLRLAAAGESDRREP